MAVFDELPDECIAQILSRTSPRDVGRCSAVSRAFRDAACTDAAWSNFLPTDLDGILLRLSSPSQLLLSGKRDVFFRLCNCPVLIDGGIMSFSLHKSTGKKCFMLGARSLSIVWGDTPEYWRWSSFYRSRFPEVVELRRVAWLEIQAKMEQPHMLSANTDYGAYLVFKLLEGNDGFENLPIEVSVSTRRSSQKGVVFLDPDGRLRQSYQQSLERFWPVISRRDPNARVLRGRMNRFPREREDGWAEVELGGFSTSEGEDEEMQMSFMEVTTSRPKSGLIIQGIEIRPK